MSLSPFYSFQSRFVTYLLNRPITTIIQNLNFIAVGASMYLIKLCAFDCMICNNSASTSKYLHTFHSQYI